MISASVGIGFWSTSTEQLLSRLLLTGVLCCLLWYKANREENFLEERYGAQYLDCGPRACRALRVRDWSSVQHRQQHRAV